MQQHADGGRLGLGITLRIAAALLARLGQARPAAVLSGAAAANFAPVGDIFPDERLDMDQALLPAREALGEAAYGGRTPKSSVTWRDMLAVAVQPKRTPGPRGGAHQPSRHLGAGAACRSCGRRQRLVLVPALPGRL